jgi:virginiamycin A acetyltransferase
LGWQNIADKAVYGGTEAKMKMFNIGYANIARYQSIEYNQKKFQHLFIDKCSYIEGMEVKSYGVSIQSDCCCHNIHIGKYTSIAENVTLLIDMNHDYHSLYKGLIPEFNDNSPDSAGFRTNGMQVFKRIHRKGQILIGNDVWIGEGVTILGGVRISDGAVVAAESVLTKDVPPYAVVGGNPAKIIKYCFDENTVESLKRIAWWDWTSDEILSRKDDMRGEVSDFVKKYDKPLKLYPRKSGQYVPRINPKMPLIVYFMDFADDFPVHTNVLKSFMKKYNALDAELLLCYNVQNKEETEQMDAIIELLQQYDDVQALINIYGMLPEDEEQIISEADMYVTNRNEKTLSRVALADRYNVSVISGVDIPVFE